MGRGGRQAVTADSEVSGAGLQGAPLTTPLWTGRVKLPAIRTPGHFRILAVEQELLQSDAVKEYIAVNPREARHPRRRAGLLPSRLAPVRLRREFII